jgi:DNA adenine methylase
MKLSACSPILRWAGSKKRSLPKILPYLPQEYDRYIEVFAGSACLFFRIAQHRAIIADNNVELMRFYTTISVHPKRVYQRFLSIPRTEQAYYTIRSLFGHERGDITRAAHFLYMNRNCFNGIYRTNNKGKFNVPFASRRVPYYPTEQDIVEAAALLSHATITCDDFEAVCNQNVRKGDFVYLDPPYYVPSKRVFREYSSAPFSRADFDRLQRTLNDIDRKGAYFLLSYPTCHLATALVGRCNDTAINVRRTIAGAVSSRGRTRESLIYNYRNYSPLCGVLTRV